MLTTEQEEVLTGLMLGDGSLELAKAGKNASLKITRTRVDGSYIDHHINVFHDLGAKRSVGQVEDKRTNKIYLRSMLHTKVNPILTEWHSKWYANGYKSVPQDLKLTPLILATWFADDGSVVVKKRTYTAKLATHGFSKKEVKFLQKQLKQTFELNFKLYQDNSGKTPHWFLMLTNKQNVRNLVQIISPVFPKGMRRKSEIWENGINLLAKKTYPKCKFCQSNKTFKNGSNSKKQIKYMCKDCKRQFVPVS